MLYLPLVAPDPVVILVDHCFHKGSLVLLQRQDSFVSLYDRFEPDVHRWSLLFEAIVYEGELLVWLGFANREFLQADRRASCP